MEDNLYRKIYAEKIATEIAAHYDSECKKSIEAKNCQENSEKENIIFAISGKWGEGKTTLLKLIEKPLIDKGFKIIYFNPWKYSQEDITLKRAFLQKIKEGIKSSVNLDDLYYDRTKTILSIDWLLILSWLVGIFFISWFISVSTGLNLDIISWLSDLLNKSDELFKHNLVDSIITILLIPVILSYLTLNRTAASVSTAEKFEEKFNELLKNESKVVIYIDDLDRCNEKTVKIILDSLKTFFQHPECSYIITGDHTVIERYAGNELELPEGTSYVKKLQEGRRFLKKLFNVYWRLPLPTPYQFGIFVDNKILESGIKLEKSQLSNLKSFLIDDDLFERNPRHVIRFLTKLRFAIEGVDLQKISMEKEENKELDDSISTLKDILSNPDLLAKVLLLEEIFYPIYEELIIHPEEFINHEKAIRSGKNPEELQIKDKKLIKLLDEKDPDVQKQLEKYSFLVKKSPKFSDENNTILHEVASYFLFSGSTGLPSVFGPDDSNFEQDIKAGVFADKIGEVLKQSKPEKKKKFADKAMEIFNQSTGQEKINTLSDSLKLSIDIKEWSDKLIDMKIGLFSLAPNEQSLLAPIFWQSVLKNNPAMIEKIKNEKPDYLETFWPMLENENYKITEDAKINIEKIIKDSLVQQPINLKGANIYLEKIGSKNIETEIDKILLTPDICKNYIDSMDSIGLLNGKIRDIAIKKLDNILSNFDNFDWSMSNKDYLKKINLFENLKNRYKKWSEDLKIFIKIAESRNLLELNIEEKKYLAEAAIGHLKKSADINFLKDDPIKTLPEKDNKIEIIRTLKDILLDSSNLLEKRIQAAQFLIKNALWGDIDDNDVNIYIKEINKKYNKIDDSLIDYVKEILNTWGYNNNLENEKDEESI